MSSPKKVKLTLLLDDDLIGRAKAYAAENGTSLSRLVAAFFKGLVSRDEALKIRPDDGPFVRHILERGPAPPVTDEEIWEERSRKYSP